MSDFPFPFVDLLESAIEASNDGIAIMRFTGNRDVPIRIVYANATVERLSGLSRRELLQPSNPFLRIQPQNRARYEALLRDVRGGKSVLFEIELTGRDRSTPCEIRWTPLQPQAGEVTHYVAVIRDISARAEATRDHELLEGVDRANYGLCIFTVPDGDIGRRQLTYVNHALGEMMKLSEEQLYERGVGTAIFSQSAAVFEDDLTQLPSLGTLERDLRLRRGDGIARWFHVTASAVLGDDGTVERVTMTYRDIEEEKHRSAPAVALEAAFADTADLVLVTDASREDEGGPRIIYVNQALSALLGIAREELAGAGLVEAIPAKLRALFTELPLRDGAGARTGTIWFAAAADLAGDEL